MSAIAAPMPRAPPVTKTTSSVIVAIVVSSSLSALVAGS